MKRGYWLLIIVVVLIVIGLILLGLFLPRAPITVEDDSILVEKNIGSLEYSSKQQEPCGIVKLDSSAYKLDSSACMRYKTEYRPKERKSDGVYVIISVHDKVRDTAISKIHTLFDERNINPTIVNGNKVYIIHSYYGSSYYWFNNGKEISIIVATICSLEFIDVLSETREFEGRKISDENITGLIKLCSGFEDIAHRYLIKYPSDL